MKYLQEPKVGKVFVGCPNCGCRKEVKNHGFRIETKPTPEPEECKHKETEKNTESKQFGECLKCGKEIYSKYSGLLLAQFDEPKSKVPEKLDVVARIDTGWDCSVCGQYATVMKDSSTYCLLHLKQSGPVRAK